ncbi:MAG: cytidylate kinase [Flavobacteriales bacterium]|nr:cytidylate kinase [Flavobacteriales bacterium]|tara:strand:+ start:246 stop:926 length:681 start_codon:yes stop_codon:yes gene_type:complete
MVKINISIDGPSSSGKSSIAASLAGLLSYKYVNTGSMYRAVTYFCLRENMFENEFCYNKLKIILSNMKLNYSYNNEIKSSILTINGKDISKHLNTIDVTDNVSFISKIKDVRLKLIEIQRNYAKDKGVVMEGRDIGTVVLPNADVKFFIQTDIDTRVKRRLIQLKSNNINVDISDLKKRIVKRDKIDSERELSPLRCPKGAFLISNNTSNFNSVLNEVYDIAKSFL